MVERVLGKDEVTSSILVNGSILFQYLAGLLDSGRTYCVPIQTVHDLLDVVSFPFHIGLGVKPSRAGLHVSRRFLRFEYAGCYLLPPTNIQMPESMHSEALCINSGPFGCWPKDMLLQIPVIRWLAMTIGSAKDELGIGFALAYRTSSAATPGACMPRFESGVLVGFWWPRPQDRSIEICCF